jgi:hypothetical protein
MEEMEIIVKKKSNAYTIGRMIDEIRKLNNKGSSDEEESNKTPSPSPSPLRSASPSSLSLRSVSKKQLFLHRLFIQ